MMRAPFSIAQSMPARTCCVVACAEFCWSGLNAWTARMRARRDAEKPSMRDDGTGHPGAVIIGLVRFANGIELLAERASEIGMCGIDLRIDDGDRYIFSDAPAMHVTQ